MKLRGIWTGMLTVALAAGVSAFNSNGPRQTEDFREIEKIVESVALEATKSGTAEGLAVLVAVGSEVQIRSAWGRTTEHQDAERSHRIGGLLPSFISAAVLQLADQDKLSLNDHLTVFFPELESAKSVRVRQLLTHTSGLPDCSGFLGDGDISATLLVPWLKERELESEPGSCFTFTLTNVVLASAIVRKVSGVEVDEYLAQVVFGPNEMEATKWCWDGPKVDENSVSGVDLPGGLVEVSDLARVHSAAGLCSTVDDLFNWQRALIDGRLLESDSYAAFTSAVRLTDGSRSYFGHGAYAMRLGDFDGFAFGGTMAGFTAHVAYYPDFELSIVLLAEGDEVPLRGLERSMARAVLDMEDPQVRDLPLENDEKARYLGTYFVGCSQILIEKADEGGRIMASWPGDRSFELLYQGRHVFVSRDDPDVSLTFEMDGEHATAFILHERGTETRAKRMR